MMNSIISVAKNTMRETIRGGVLWAVALVSALLVFGVALFGSVSIGNQSLVVRDFSYFVMSFLPVVFVTLVGASLVQKEISRKTIYHILSKPVSRRAVMLGKFCGLYGVAIELFCVTLVVSFLAHGVIVGSWFEVFRPELLLILAELIVVSALVIFFSSIVVTPLLAGVFTFGVFLAGRSIDYIKMFSESTQSVLGKAILTFLYWALPSLSSFVPKRDLILSEVALSSTDLLLLGGYALLYSASILILGQVFFSRRDFP